MSIRGLMLSNEQALNEKFVIEMCKICQDEHINNQHIIVICPYVWRKPEIGWM